jgi:predicted ATPase/DNA-binding SARP family transcriptional activator
MEVGLLGPLEVRDDNGELLHLGASRQRALLTLLALRPGVVVPVERLIDELWGAEGPREPSNALQVIVFKLRRTIGTGRVITRPPGYALVIEPDDVDALRFERLARDGRAALASGNIDVAIDTFDAALGLFRGDALADVHDAAVAVAAASRWDELRASISEDRFDALLACGRHREVIVELEEAVARAPFRERLRAQQMLALYRSGRQAESLQVFSDTRRILADELGLEPSAELRQLEIAVLNQDQAIEAPMGTQTKPRDDSRLEAPSRESSERPIGEGFRRRGNVRHPVGPCIGRAEELDQLLGLVRDHRLVTITGPGGVGKTRLALELCVGLKDKVTDGVWWVELASARSDADVLAAVQRSLGMGGSGANDPAAALDAVATVLSDRSAVLALDNCEHILEPLVPIVEELLGRCGELRVVATSREGLDVPAERRFDVAPLRQSAAVELFEARIAGSVNVEAGSIDAIVEICEQLDRLPLALELAAARTRHFRLEEIRDRLSNRFELLREGPRTMQAHHRNLRAVADWSYELLDEQERTVFERLSVFADGATTSAATAVCAHDEVGVADVERLLHRLVDKSLIVADRSGGQTRFRMLQTLVDYASERLDARGGRDSVLRAHAHWVRDLASTVQFGAETSGAAVATVQEEDVAIRDAVTWALDSDPTLALEICNALSEFWFGTMRVPVGWELLSAALAAADSRDRALRSSALAWACVFATMVQDQEMAIRHADEAVAFERELGDPARLGKICFARALSAGYRSGIDADVWIAEANVQFSAAGMPIGLGHVSFAEGAVRLVYGDLDAAATSLRNAIAIFGEHEDHLGLILAVSRLGELAWRRGDMELFADMHAELLELGRASRSAGVIAGATARLALARLVQGDLDEAQQLARTALASSSESLMPVVNGYAFKTAGLVNLQLGHLAEGRGHLRAAIEAFEQGTGSVGLGQAAMCWVDLSHSYTETGDAEAAQRAAQIAVEVATSAGDPWVQEQTEACLSLVMTQALTM